MDSSVEVTLQKTNLYGAFSDKIQRSRFLKYLAKHGAIYAGATAGLGVLGWADMEFIGSGYAQLTLDALVNAKDFLLNPERSQNDNPYLFIGTRSVLGITALGLGVWGLSNKMAQSYSADERIMNSVLTTPHGSVGSEMDTYVNRSGRPHSQWESDLDRFFDTMAQWRRIEGIGEALDSNNLRIDKRIPKKVFTGETYCRPTLDEMIHGMGENGIEFGVDIGNKKPTRISFKLPPQLNQNESYFEGYVFDPLSTEPRKFIGLESVVAPLSNGQFVIGSIGPAEPKPFSRYSKIFGNRKRAKLAERIKEVLSPFYYAKAGEDDVRIAIVSEGTFPWIRGGVSTVLDDLVKTLGPDQFHGRNVFYEVASTMSHPDPFSSGAAFDFLENIHINPPVIDYGFTQNPAFNVTRNLPNSGFLSRLTGKARQRREDEIKRTIFDLEAAVRGQDFDLFYDVADRIKMYFSVDEIFNSKSAIKAVHELYHTVEDGRKPDFMTFFYQWSSIRKPLIRVIKSDKVEADVYYSVIAGVGGVYAALSKREFGKRMVLTEHGINREDRMVDIATFDVSPFLLERWQQTLGFYTKLSYAEADSITSLCTSSKHKQIRDGADPAKLQVIPNGLVVRDPNGYQTDPDVFTVGLLGNVQRVKQVEYFIHAVAYLKKEHPDIRFQFHVMGRDDVTDPAYVRQIHNLVDRRKLGDVLYFSPYSDWHEAFAKLDCGVLTSASEVQSKAIMELLSLGKPMIAPDIGGNKELIYGHGIDDFGRAGIVYEGASVENVVARSSEAIVALQELKSLRIHGNTNTPTILANGLRFLLDQGPIEAIGPKRIQTYFATEKVMPKYADLFLGAMRT